MRKFYFLIYFIPALILGQNQNKVDSLLSLIPTQKDSTLIWTYRELFNEYVVKDPTKAKPYLDTILRMAEESIRSANFNGYLQYDQGIYKTNIGNYNAASQNLQMAIDSFAKAKNKPMTEVGYNTLGITLRYMGKLDEALKSYMTSIRISKEIGAEEDERAKKYMNIGVIHAELGNIELSNEYYRKTEAICLEYGIEWGLAITQSNLASNRLKEKKYNEALDLYFKALDYFIANNDRLEIAEQYGHLGNTYFGMQLTDRALEYYKKSFNEAEKVNDNSIMIQARRNIGNTLYAKNNFLEALKNYEASLNLALKTGNTLETKDNLLKIAETYAKLGKYKDAYHYRQKHFLTYDSIFQKEKIEQFNEIEVQYQSEIKEAEIAFQKEELQTLIEKAKVDNLKKGLYAGGMASFVAVSGLLFFGFRQRIKKNRIAREKQDDIYKQEIAHKQKELTSQTLHLVQKSKFINQLKDNLEEIKNSPEKFKIEFKRIVLLLKKENSADKDWEVFKSYFSEVHQNFDEQLKQLAANTTDKELRLASYVKMGLNNIEIANILNVLPSSIHTSKYRLKQKLNIDKEIDFDTFIKSL